MSRLDHAEDTNPFCLRNCSTCANVCGCLTQISQHQLRSSQSNIPSCSGSSHSGEASQQHLQLCICVGAAMAVVAIADFFSSHAVIVCATSFGFAALSGPEPVRVPLDGPVDSATRGFQLWHVCVECSHMLLSKQWDKQAKLSFRIHAYFTPFSPVNPKLSEQETNFLATCLELRSEDARSRPASRKGVGPLQVATMRRMRPGSTGSQRALKTNARNSATSH